MTDPNSMAGGNWADVASRQRIAAKLDEIIRDYPGPPPISMHDGGQLENAIYAKAKSKEEYHQLAQKLIHSLRQRSIETSASRSGAPSTAVQPGMMPPGHAGGMQPQGPRGVAGYNPMGGHHPHSFHSQPPPHQPQPHQPQPHQPQPHQPQTHQPQPHQPQPHQPQPHQPQPHQPQPHQPQPHQPQPHQPQPHQPQQQPSYYPSHPVRVGHQPARIGPHGQPGYDVMPNRPMSGTIPQRTPAMPPYQPRPPVPSGSTVPRPINPATPGSGMSSGSAHGPYASYAATSGSQPTNTAPSGLTMSQHHPQHPSQARSGPSGGPVPSPSMIMSPRNTAGQTGPPSVPPHVDPAEYDAKIKELLNYVPLVKRMIDNLMRTAHDDDAGKKSEHITRLKLFLAGVQDPEKRLPMHMLDRWMDVLRKVTDPKPQSHPPAVLDLEPSSPPPSQNKLYGKRTKVVFEDRIPAKYRKIAGDVTCMDFLSRELECMEEHFVVQTVKKPTDSDKKVELQCFIEDDGLPKVPPLKITLTPSYPDSCPEVDMKEYANSFKFLDIIQQHLNKWMQSQANSFLLSNILQAWESSVKLALRDVLSQKE